MSAIMSHPLQLRILAAAQHPISAAELSRQLGLPRQRLNYHVQQLAKHGFLVPVAQRRKRNMVEQLYQAAPSEPAADSVSVEQLAAVYARAQAELALVSGSAARAGVRVRTVALQHELHFSRAADRQEFMQALVEAVNGVVAEFAADEKQPNTRAVRLVLGCYPLPAESI